VLLGAALWAQDQVIRVDVRLVRVRRVIPTT
jgi:hypothetical protein